jgi:hypothetical protein
VEAAGSRSSKTLRSSSLGRVLKCAGSAWFEGFATSAVSTTFAGQSIDLLLTADGTNSPSYVALAGSFSISTPSGADIF